MDWFLIKSVIKSQVPFKLPQMCWTIHPFSMACGTPLSVSHPLKMVPSYSLLIYPPKPNPNTGVSVHCYWDIFNFLKAPNFGKKYSNGPGVTKSWYMSKLTKKDPRIFLKVSWVQVWQKIPMGSVPNRQLEILMLHAIRCFKCKLKPPKILPFWQLCSVGLVHRHICL